MTPELLEVLFFPLKVLLEYAATTAMRRQEVAIKHIYGQREAFLLPSSAHFIYVQNNESGERARHGEGNDENCEEEG